MLWQKVLVCAIDYDADDINSSVTLGPSLELLYIKSAVGAWLYVPLRPWDRDRRGIKSTIHAQSTVRMTFHAPTNLAIPPPNMETMGMQPTLSSRRVPCPIWWEQSDDDASGYDPRLRYSLGLFSLFNSVLLDVNVTVDDTLLVLPIMHHGWCQRWIERGDG
ncbi:hypothetical protein BDZ89DRAFT_1141156 [Hymenopellis radicata]|nr:hypothetical protein BDZ89DRAFT_1141156 [Hymenopellis radicata]